MKCIQTRYISPSNTRGARITAHDSDGNRVTVPYPHDARDPHEVAVRALCARMDWHGQLLAGASADGKGYTYVWVEPSRLLTV